MYCTQLPLRVLWLSLLAVCFHSYVGVCSLFFFLSYVFIDTKSQTKYMYMCSRSPLLGLLNDVSSWNFQSLYLTLTALICVWLIINISLTAHHLWTHSAIVQPENTWKKLHKLFGVLSMAIYGWTITLSVFAHALINSLIVQDALQTYCNCHFVDGQLRLMFWWFLPLLQR